MIEETEKKKGEWLVFWNNFLWSFFPIFVVLSLSQMTGLVSLAWSTVYATIFFFFLMIYRKSWHFLKSGTFWRDAFLVALFNSILFYGLYYWGLEYTTPGNASLISRFEILTSFLYFSLFHHERISKDHGIGMFLMIIGGLMVVFHDFSRLNPGDLFILLATISGPIGNYFQQKIRKISSVESMLFARYLISIPFTFLIAFGLNQKLGFSPSWNIFSLLFFNGFVILGLAQIFWVEAIHRITATKAIALSSAGPLMTIALAWLILRQVPTLPQLLAFIPLSLGVLFLTDSIKYKNYVKFI